MKLVCPSCGATASAAAWANDAAARDALALVLALPAPVREQALAYLALFRPPKRALTWDRAGTLLRQLRDLVALRELSWKRKLHRPVTPELWAQGMRQMIRDKAGSADRFDSHGYLAAIVYGLADDADGQREARERKAEAQHRAPEAEEEPEGLTEEGRRQLEKVKGLFGGIGRVVR